MKKINAKMKAGFAIALTPVVGGLGFLWFSMGTQKFFVLMTVIAVFYAFLGYGLWLIAGGLIERDQ